MIELVCLIWLVAKKRSWKHKWKVWIVRCLKSLIDPQILTYFRQSIPINSKVNLERTLSWKPNSNQSCRKTIEEVKATTKKFFIISDAYEYRGVKSFIVGLALIIIWMIFLCSLGTELEGEVSVHLDYLLNQHFGMIESQSFQIR